MYMIGSLDFLKKEDQERLVKAAKNYVEDGFEMFAAEIGFESWMEEFMENPNEEINEADSDRINAVLKEAFKKANS